MPTFKGNRWHFSACFFQKGLYSGWFTTAAGERSLPAAPLSTQE